MRVHGKQISRPATSIADNLRNTSPARCYMAHGGDVILRPQGDEDTAIMTFTPKTSCYNPRQLSFPFPDGTGIPFPAERRCEMDVTRWRWAAVAKICLLLSLTALGRAVQNEANTSPDSPQEKKEVQATSGATEAKAPVPMRSIDLEPLGFRRLSPLRSRDGSFQLTFSFFDEDLLLMTFEGSEMVRRHKNCPPTHDDRVVHAVVIDW